MDYLLFNKYNGHSNGGPYAFGQNKFCPPYPSCSVGYYTDFGNIYQNQFDLSLYFTMGYDIGQYQDVSECPILGCMDDTACNYDSNAICDDNSCEYIQEIDLGEDITTCEESITLDAFIPDSLLGYSYIVFFVW